MGTTRVWILAVVAVVAVAGCSRRDVHYLVEPSGAKISAEELIESHATEQLRRWRAAGEFGSMCLLNIREDLVLKDGKVGEGERHYEFLAEGSRGRAVVSVVFRMVEGRRGSWVHDRNEVRVDAGEVAALEAKSKARKCEPSEGDLADPVDAHAWGQADALALLSRSSTWALQGVSMSASRTPLLGNSRSGEDRTWLIQGAERPVLLTVAALDTGDGPGITACSLTALGGTGGAPLP